MNTAMDLFKLYSTLPAAARDAFPFQNPVLLRKEIQASLAQELGELPIGQRQSLEPVLPELQTLLTKLEHGERKYPIGICPLEMIARRVEDGEISVDYAEELARAPEVMAGLASIYAIRLSTFSAALIQEGAWRRAVLLQRLLLAAAEQLPNEANGLQIRRTAGLDWVEVVAQAVRNVPDGRLWRRAVQIGETLLAEASTDGDFAGLMNHRLGVLHLDPYTAGRMSERYDVQLNLWRQALYDEYREELPHLSDEEIKEMEMPEPQEALPKAEAYLRQAVRYRQGDGKGLSLKALLQALEWEKVLGLPVKQDEFVQIAKEALKYLDPISSIYHRLAVLAMLRRADQEIDAGEAQRFFAKSLDEYLKGRSPGESMDLLLQASGLFSEQDPWRCLDLLVRTGGLFDRYADENYQAVRLEQILNIIRNRLAPRFPPITSAQDLLRLAQDLLNQKDMDAVELSAGLTYLATHSTPINSEDLGLELLQRAVQTAPDFWEHFNDAYLLLDGNLKTGVAVNALQENNLLAAVEAYFEAVVSFIELRFSNHILDLLGRIDDLILRSGTDNELTYHVIASLGDLALRLESEFGPAATDKIQDLLLHAFMRSDLKAANPEAINFILQIAKGLRFSAALRQGARFDVLSDPTGRDLLQQISLAEAALEHPFRSGIDADAALNQNLLLSAYVQANERQSGDTPEERHTNLQKRFDAYLNSQLLSEVSKATPQLLNVEEIQASLDERTVLLNYYLGGGPEGNLAIIVFLFTRQEMNLTGIVHNFPLSKLSMGYEDKQIMITPFALTIGGLRDDVLAEPGPWPVSRKAGTSLKTDLQGYLGSLLERLKTLRQAGKDHLLIIPHGPLHFYPFHLLGEMAKPLADDWKVTYLPNLSLLAREVPQPKPNATRKLSSIGISFEKENPFGLDPLPESLNEARAVAAVFDCEPILEEQATKRETLEALRSSRYAHISTHGQHNVSAAFFQCLFLAPDGESDGRLYAYELLPLDLSGLELVTLSACETALGRFDGADNLRGLPAAFLLAGVRTIIGTLWPVAPKPAELFFATLYREIKADVGILDAFYAAQQATYRQFPKYRDWGAFYLIGQSSQPT